MSSIVLPAGLKQGSSIASAEKLIDMREKSLHKIIDAAVAPYNTQDNIAKHPSNFIGKSPSCIKQAAAKQSAQTSSVPKRSGLGHGLVAYSHE